MFLHQLHQGHPSSSSSLSPVFFFSLFFSHSCSRILSDNNYSFDSFCHHHNRQFCLYYVPFNCSYFQVMQFLWVLFIDIRRFGYFYHPLFLWEALVHWLIYHWINLVHWLIYHWINLFDTFCLFKIWTWILGIWCNMDFWDHTLLWVMKNFKNIAFEDCF